LKPATQRLIEGEAVLKGLVYWALHQGVRVLFILGLAIVVIRAANRILARFETKLRTEDVESGRGGHRSQTLIEVSRGMLAITVWGLAFLLILGQLGINLGPLIAGAGIAGVAIGFGAQTLVKDFFTGFFVLLEDQFRVGDTIEIEGCKGVVERFTLRLTSIRAADGTLQHVANGHIQKVSNSTAGWSKNFVDVVVPYGAEPEAVNIALTEAGQDLFADPKYATLLLEAPSVLGMEALSDTQLTFRVEIKSVPVQQATTARAYRSLVRKAFQAKGIAMSAPAASSTEGASVSSAPNPASPPGGNPASPPSV